MSDWPGNDNEAFVYFCRQKGTRCDDIITMIEQGVPDRVNALKHDTDVRTIRVYRKALEGKLSIPKFDMDQDGARHYSAEYEGPKRRIVPKEIRHRRLYITDYNGMCTLLTASTGMTLSRLARRLHLNNALFSNAAQRGYMSVATATAIQEATGIDLVKMGYLTDKEEETEYGNYS